MESCRECGVFTVFNCSGKSLKKCSKIEKYNFNDTPILQISNKSFYKNVAFHFTKK